MAKIIITIEDEANSEVSIEAEWIPPPGVGPDTNAKRVARNALNSMVTSARKSGGTAEVVYGGKPGRKGGN